MTSLSYGLQANVASGPPPWLRTAPLRRWPLGLLLVGLHIGLAVLLWQAGRGAPPLLKPELRPLTWVHLAPMSPEPPSPRPATAAPANRSTNSNAAPLQLFQAQPSHLDAPSTASTTPPPDSHARADTALPSEPRTASVAQPSPAAPAPRAISPATPKELPSSALRYIVPPAQAYPLRSQRLGEQGTVWLRLLVNAEGLPVSVVVARSSGHARLDEQAVAAMRAARFAPHIDNGQALEWTALAPLTYELE